MYKTVALACDHAGFSVKNELMLHLSSRGIEFRDFGTYNEESCDLPVLPLPLAARSSRENAIARSSSAEPVSECRSWRTKFDGIRAACCSDTFSARFTRLHNDANVLCMGARVVGSGLAVDMVDLFLDTEFENSGNHPRRVALLAEIERLTDNRYIKHPELQSLGCFFVFAAGICRRSARNPPKVCPPPSL